MNAAAKNGVLDGECISLRPLRVEDVGPHYVRWMNDPEINRFLESRFRSWSHDDLVVFVRDHAGRRDAFIFAILEKASGRHVGNIKVGPVASAHGTASVGLLIGERSCWGKGYGTDAIRLACDYSFCTLRLRRLTAGAYATNTGALAAFRKAGFAVEGRQRQHRKDGDVYVDGILLGLMRTDWLEIRR